MLPPFVHDTLAWLRSETVLPAGSAAAVVTNDETAPRREPGAYAAPFAAAIAGAIPGGALILFWALGLPSFAIAAATVATLAAVSGARLESGTVRAGDKLASRAGAGAAALLLLLLVEIAALDGLVALHAPSAALAAIAAVVLAFAASITFRLTQPARPVSEIGETPRRSHGEALQGLTLVTIVVATALLLPVFRIGPTAAGLIGALAAFVCVVALAKDQNEADVEDNSFAAGKAAEVAALLAILAFTRAPQ
jgi:cobalamin synthase